MNDTNALQLHILHNKDDEDLEWVEEEFETLTERDFYNTEWKIGTLMDNKPRDPKSIDTTWVRLSTTEEGTFPFHYALFASDLCDCVSHSYCHHRQVPTKPHGVMARKASGLWMFHHNTLVSPKKHLEGFSARRYGRGILTIFTI